MPTEDARAATLADPDGNKVVLLVRIWQDKIARDHPELVDHLGGVIETIASPITLSQTRCPVVLGSTAVMSAPADGCWWS